MPWTKYFEAEHLLAIIPLLVIISLCWGIIA
jgi:hypothetical protein